MSTVIDIFGKHIYKLAQKNPRRTVKELALAYSAAGLQYKYFPSKKLLPARQYMEWAATDSAVRPLRKPDQSAIVSIYLPCEVLHAMGISQMFPEALSCYLAASSSEKYFIETAEADGIPKTFCSYHKAFIGMMESGVLPRPGFIVNTSLACDANHLSFKRAADFYEIPRFMVDVPYEYNEKNLLYLEGRLRDMTSFIEETTGKKLDEAALKDVIDTSKRTILNYRRMLEIRKDIFLSDEMTSHMLSLFATHVMLGTKEAEKYTEDMIAQMSALPKEKKGVRILWVHTLPYWQEALKDLVNFSDRCEIVACDMSLDAIDIDISEEDPYRFMADRLLRNSMNGPGERRIERALEYARFFDADGIVWYCHWGCKHTAGNSSRAKEIFEKNGFPTLVLDGDGCDSRNVNDGQTVTRMEAFIELMESRK